MERRGSHAASRSPAGPIQSSSPHQTISRSTPGPGKNTSSISRRGVLVRHLMAVASQCHAHPPIYSCRVQWSHSRGVEWVLRLTRRGTTQSKNDKYRRPTFLLGFYLIFA